MLELKEVYKDYVIDKTAYPALKNINLYFENVGFVAILGPSGCGKTTLLNIIGGLDKYTSGDLIIEGISTKKYKDKDWDNYRNKRIGFVFQSYNLIPHLSILENVELSLTLSGMSAKERKDRAKECLTMVGLEDIIHKKPNQMSGGQMQRVAIARSIVNNPEIILADEPTGALDSETSIQVMEILKKVAEKHLVIMVTHNEELARLYANRIITVKDGEVTGDTAPAYPKPEDLTRAEELTLITESEKKVHKTKEKNKTSMGFGTSLAHSFKNIWTKKGRTILTSVAASFGIIGVALVLALSNGFTNYIDKVQSETATQLPVTVSPYNVTYTTNPSNYSYEQYTDEEYIYPYVTAGSTVSYTYNNITEKYFNYLRYLRDEKGLVSDYIVNYSSSYAFNLMTDFPQSDGTSELGIVQNGTVTSFTSIISSYIGIPTTYFHVLYGEEETIENNYDLLAGTYPQNSNEMVLVVDSYNRLSPTILQRLGFYSSDAEDEDMYNNPISFDDILNKKYKVFTLDEFYEEGRTVSRTDTLGNDRSFINYKERDYEELFNDDSVGTTLKITGILRPASSSSLDLFAGGLCYLPSLQEELVTANEQSDLYNNFSQYVEFTGTSLMDFVSDLLGTITNNENGSYSYSLSDINSVLNSYFRFNSYLYTSESTYGYTNFSGYTTYASKLGIDLLTENFIENGVGDISNVFSSLLTALSGNDVDAGYEEIISLFAYINSYSAIESVIIFPKSLTAKDAMLEALDEYNNIYSSLPDEYHALSESEIVTYSDIVGTVVSGLSEIITIISTVLIIFASISLAVSCVMTGIITYASVIERTKEIGILRALGARKRDVGRLFEAENCIVGAFSGLVGCGVAYLVCIPINAIINAIFSGYGIGSIASLNPLHALLLIAISIVLTFISGFIPSRMAAKKDPVIALRSE